MVILVLLSSAMMLVACSDDGIPTDSTIVSKEIIDGSYYFNVTYDLEGFNEPLTATIMVPESIFDQYEVGDTYVFNRPDISDNYRNS